MKITTETEVKDLTRGAVLLGTGGGGDPYIGELLLRQQLSEGRHVDVVDVDELDDEAFIVCVAGIGAPTVLVEHLQANDVCLQLLRSMEKVTGRQVDAIIPAEVGGLNSVIPLALGAQVNLPVVNADGMGRAFPHIDMVTYSVYGSRACPMVLANELGDQVIIESATSDRKVEDIARVVTGALGAMTYGCLYPMSGKDVKEKAIRNSISYSMGIGAAIRVARQRSHDPVASLVSYLHQPNLHRFAKVLFDGKVVDVRRETRDGWHIATIDLCALHDSEDRFTIELQNEYLRACHNGVTVCIVPDLVSIVDRETAEPLTGERIKYGLRVKVIGLSADAMMRREECLCVFGPAAFGFSETFTPLEKLVDLL